MAKIPRTFFSLERLTDCNSFSAITKTNWEGAGVTPDIAVPAEQALLVARITALRKSLSTLQNPEFKAGVQDELEKLEKELSAMKAKS